MDADTRILHILKRFNKNGVALTPAVDILDDLDLDSLDLLNFVSEIEVEFSLKFTDSDLYRSNFKSVETIVELIKTTKEASC